MKKKNYIVVKKKKTIYIAGVNFVNSQREQWRKLSKDFLYICIYNIINSKGDNPFYELFKCFVHSFSLEHNNVRFISILASIYKIKITHTHPSLFPGGYRRPFIFLFLKYILVILQCFKNQPKYFKIIGAESK